MTAGNSGAELTVKDFLVVLRRHWRVIGGIGVAGAVLFYGVSFLIPPTFKAGVTLIPMASRDPVSGLGGLGFDLQSLGIAPSTGELTPIMFPEIARSRTVLGSLLADSFYVFSGPRRIRYFDWLRVKGEGGIRRERGLKILHDRVEASANRRTGTITVTVVERDPDIAAVVANAVAAELQKFVVSVQATHAGAKRRFIEERLREIRADLSRAESELKQFREQNLRIGNSPRLALDEARLVRGVREQEEVYLTVSRQYELARIEENRDVPVLATLDPATPPAQKHWPRRGLLGLVGLALAGSSMTFWMVYRSTPTHDPRH